MSIEKFVREKVSDNLEKKQGVPKIVSFDPSIILTIITIISTLFESCDLFQKKPEDIKQSLNKIGLFERWALRQQVKHYIDDSRVFKLYGGQIVNAIIEAGPLATVDEIKAALDERSV